MFLRVVPGYAITARAAESRMGSGKGTLDYWVAPVKPGTVIFEVKGMTVEEGKKAFKDAAGKLPCKVKFLYKKMDPSEINLNYKDTTDDTESIEDKIRRLVRLPKGEDIPILTGKK